MLTRTFIHIPTVGAKREVGLWKAGLRHWDDFLAHGEALAPPAVYRLGRPVIQRSLAALNDPHGLAELAGLIPSSEHWRFWPRYNRVAYLDIETGGDPADFGGITVVGVYDGSEVVQYVAGKNLNEAAQALAGYQVVVSFAGSSFDVPVLKSVFPRFIVPPVHIDLRWVLRRLGHKGGLKRIEKALGLSRPDHVGDMDGYMAVMLWQDHLAGDPDALATLLDYNACDIVNLEPLLNLAVERLRSQTLGRLS
ncbi:MAG: ribonuclease H-like domain-containing protein [Desulfarculaceae bacterium]|nr:ribonuclease H-like domain-containing protein [Desulfarculaceae bacterium]MCF8073866.1 ribonuclease H-like domain-containing protein [Desulfarculaceae bacterium]MCF8102846.1 ribonuclease H-like domain-containing protein [Desulfarculaceae bacterium]MCF8116290.1 ribonuclease H-like domain-containing protein [Desulfarculaceae bacterium]